MALAEQYRCSACRDGVGAPFEFSMAFQPIIDIARGEVYAYEALARGIGQTSARSIMSQVNEQNRYAFDQQCRIKAIRLAASLGLCNGPVKLAINFMPGAVYSPAACIKLTLKTAAEVGFPLDKLIFEVTENEQVSDTGHLRQIVDQYRQHGFKIAIDDFGAGHSGLNLLADFPADMIKLDHALTRNIHERPQAWTIVQTIVKLARTLGSDIVAEGVEREEEYRVLRNCGIRLMQGYLFAKPTYEALPDFKLPAHSGQRIVGHSLKSRILGV